MVKECNEAPLLNNEWTKTEFVVGRIEMNGYSSVLLCISTDLVPG